MTERPRYGLLTSSNPWSSQHQEWLLAIELKYLKVSVTSLKLRSLSLPFMVTMMAFIGYLVAFYIWPLFFFLEETCKRTKKLGFFFYFSFGKSKSFGCNFISVKFKNSFISEVKSLKFYAIGLNSPCEPFA